MLLRLTGWTRHQQFLNPDSRTRFNGQNSPTPWDMRCLVAVGSRASRGLARPLVVSDSLNQPVSPE